MRFAAAAFCVLLSATIGAAREVNEDDLPGDCRYDSECQNVVRKAKSCGDARSTGGDVFSDYYWIECTCGQTGQRELDDCVSCTQSYQNGGDILQLQRSCAQRKR
ncbi:hypothetical protein Slin15195_G092040 [Septoria linicola]|uniref:Uncharacterized protein n=1 Tax=Septoria linicola TaxID=215465 RepID=A0A9Q9B0G6_9PEZI|nr:hypothetical protein Slin15195_G092040 [Septoria linicola]